MDATQTTNPGSETMRDLNNNQIAALNKLGSRGHARHEIDCYAAAGLIRAGLAQWCKTANGANALDDPSETNPLRFTITPAGRAALASL